MVFWNSCQAVTGCGFPLCLETWLCTAETPAILQRKQRCLAMGNQGRWEQICLPRNKLCWSSKNILYLLCKETWQAVNRDLWGTVNSITTFLPAVLPMPSLPHRLLLIPGSMTIIKLEQRHPLPYFLYSLGLKSRISWEEELHRCGTWEHAHQIIVWWAQGRFKPPSRLRLLCVPLGAWCTILTKHFAKNCVAWGNNQFKSQPHQSHSCCVFAGHHKGLWNALNC